MKTSMDLVQALAAVAAEEAMLIVDRREQVGHARSTVFGAYSLACELVDNRSSVVFELSDTLARFRDFCDVVERSR